jgi:hypothetical protein
MKLTIGIAAGAALLLCGFSPTFRATVDQFLTGKSRLCQLFEQQGFARKARCRSVGQRQWPSATRAR